MPSPLPSSTWTEFSERSATIRSGWPSLLTSARTASAASLPTESGRSGAESRSQVRDQLITAGAGDGGDVHIIRSGLQVLGDPAAIGLNELLSGRPVQHQARHKRASRRGSP